MSICFFLWLGGKFFLPLCFPFLLGTGLALTAEPLVRLLCVRLHLPRGLAAGIGVTAAFLGLTMLVLLILAFLVRELGILAGILPDLSQTARSGILLLQNWMMDMAGRMPQSVRPLLEQELSFDELANLVDFPISKLNSHLTMLELRGIIEKAPGGLYRAYT